MTVPKQRQAIGGTEAEIQEKVMRLAGDRGFAYWLLSRTREELVAMGCVDRWAA